MIQQYNMCHCDLGITICDVVHTICRLSIYWQPDMHAFLMQYSLSMKYQYSLGPTQYETMQVYARYKSLKHMYAWYSACNAINVPVSAFFKLAQIGDPPWSWSSLSTACGRPCSWGVDQPIIDQVPPPTFVQGMSPSLLLNSSLPWGHIGPPLDYRARGHDTGRIYGAIWRRVAHTPASQGPSMCGGPGLQRDRHSYKRHW